MNNNQSGNMRSKIVFLLDESRSMRERNTLNVMKNFVNELVLKKKVTTDTVIDVWKFGSASTKVQNVENLNYVYGFFDYDPSGGSALYDCMYEVISDNYEWDDVLFVTITDGLDNLSLNIDKEIILNTVLEMKTEKDWDFVFLDKGLDDFQSVLDERVELNKFQNVNEPPKLVRYEYCGSPDGDRSFFKGEKIIHSV